MDRRIREVLVGRLAEAYSLLALAIVLVIVIATVVAIRSRTPDEAVRDTNPPSPTASSWNDSQIGSPSPTASPQDEPSGSAPSRPSDLVRCGTVGQVVLRTSHGRALGGGLAVPILPGWNPDGSIDDYLKPAYDLSGEVTGSLDYPAEIGVGALRRSDGFRTVRQAAEAVMQCIYRKGYNSFYVRRADRVNMPHAVDGMPGWLLESDLIRDRNRDMDENPQPAERWEVIVVDTGTHHDLAVAAATAPTKDKPHWQQIDTAMKGLGRG